MKVVLDNGAKMPTKAYDLDAGFDLYAIDGAFIPAHGAAVFDTGVHLAIPKGYAGVLISKSGLNVHRDLTSTGLIDAGYTGSIKVKLYNHGERKQIISPGDKVSQIVIMPIENKVHLELVEKLEDDSERGEKGFGSSGK